MTQATLTKTASSQPSVHDPVDLNAGFAYQADGIVSRILVKEPTGSVTAFAFDGGQELSEHSCPYEALIVVIAGQGIVTVGGQPHTLEAGQTIRLPAGVPHAVRAEQPFKMLLTMHRAVQQ